MANVTAAEKAIIVMSKLLQERGWNPVGVEHSDIHVKNNVYFVMHGSKGYKVLTSASGTIRNGFRPTIHDNFGWYVECDGFLLDSGKLGRFFTSAFDYNMTGEGYDKAVEFADAIDKFSNYSEQEIMKSKKKEIKMNFGAKSSEELVRIGNIADSRMFVVDPLKNPRITEAFEKDSVYKITDSKDQVFTVVSENSGKGLTISVNDLSGLIQQGSVVPVDRIEHKIDNFQFAYNPILTEGSLDIGDSFNDFNLTGAQKTVIGSIVAKGGNFTPLLDRRYDTASLEVIGNIILNGVDCSSMVGKKFSMEVLQFLEGLSNNNFPISGFCIEGAEVEFLSNKYSNFLETIDGSLKEFDGRFPKDVIQAIREEAFQFKGIQHLLDADCKNAAEVVLVSLKEVEPRFREAAELLLRKGTVDAKSDGTVSVVWPEIEPEIQRKILAMFQVPSVKIGDMEFNELITGRSVNSLKYTKGIGFLLDYGDFSITTDYNSVAFWRPDVKWRVVRVNEKDYVYESPYGVDL